MKRRSFFLIIILYTLFLSACGNETRTTKEAPEQEGLRKSEDIEKNMEEDSDTYEPFSTIAINNSSGWMNAGPGKFQGDTYDEAIVQTEIDQWPTDLEAEEYFHRILALTAEDYRVHQEYLDNIIVEFDDPSSRPDAETVSENDDEEPIQSGLNIQILLDASGSMAAQVDGGVKMELAKDAIAEFASALPDNAQVSLRVYGHKGTNEREGKELSCATTEEVYPLGEYNEEEFSKSLEAFGPTGYTPLAAAIKAAGEDLSSVHETGTQSVVYVVSDGIETCEGDPVNAAKELQDSNIEAIVNIIGFDIEEAERAALEAIAEAGAGEYFRADTADELKETLRKQKQELLNAWQEWINENVSKNVNEVSNYLTPAYEHEEAALEKSKLEEERQINLTTYMEEISDTYETRKIRELIQERTRGMRQYIRKEFVEIRQEARNKGLELRENVREEGYKERDNINNEE